MQDFEAVIQTTYLGAWDADVTPERMVFIAPCDCRIVGVKLADSTAKTGDDTNYGIYELRKKLATGLGTAVVATLSTLLTVDLVAHVAKTIPLSGTIANLNIPAGTAVTFLGTEAGAATSGDLVKAALAIAWVPGYSSV